METKNLGHEDDVVTEESFIAVTKK